MNNYYVTRTVVSSWDISESKTDKDTCPTFGACRGERQKVNIMSVSGEEKIKQEKGTGVGEKRPIWLDPLAPGRLVS